MFILAQPEPNNATGCNSDNISIKTPKMNIDIRLVSQITPSSFSTQSIVNQQRTEQYMFIWKSHDPNDPRNTIIELPCIEREKHGVQETE